jgi:hypothetical protein
MKLVADMASGAVFLHEVDVSVSVATAVHLWEPVPPGGVR